MRPSMQALAALALILLPGVAVAVRPPRAFLQPLYTVDTEDGSRPARAPALGSLLTSSLPGDPAPDPFDVNWVAMPLPATWPNVRPVAFADFEGDLLIGGNIWGAGTARARGVTRWDGSHFNVMGLPPTTVVDIYVWNGVPYAATGWTGVSAQVHRWNGVNWDPIGSMNGPVNKLAEFGGELIAAGDFTSVNGVAAIDVAAFEGTSWNALPGLPAGSTIVNDACSLGGFLYAGLNVPNGGIYRWNGATWSIVGTGLNNEVRGLADDGANLYAVGSFTKAGPDSTPGVAKWTGSQWQRVGVATAPSISRVVWWNGALYCSYKRLSRFDGVNWSQVATPFTSDVRLSVYGGQLVMSGSRNPSAPGDQFSTALYDGTTWTPIREAWTADMRGLDHTTFSATVWNDHLIVGGWFNAAGTGTQVISANYEAQWDGSAWSALGVTNGAGHEPAWLAPWGSELVATGWVNEAIPCGDCGGGLAHWNGSSWQYFTPDFFPYVYAAVEHLGSLYVGGDFNQTYATVPDSIRHVARWNGAGWDALGDGLRLTTSLPFDFAHTYALASWNGLLVAAGEFDLAGGQPASNVAAWDGGQWSTLGAGLDGDCYALTTWNGVLVAGGEFLNAGGNPAPGAAFWDGASWHSMGSEAVEITDFAQLDGVLYAVGEFRHPDASVSNTVARWTGSSWQTLGSGARVGALAWVEGYHGDVYAGGGLAYAFGKATAGLIRLPAANTLAVGDAPIGARVALAASPNPAHGLTTFAFALPQAGRVRLVVYDAAGRNVATLLDGDALSGRHEVRWSAPVTPGVYFARLDAPGGARRVTRVVRFE